MNSQLRKLSPILWTNDLAGTKHFYEDVLGFTGRSNFPDFISLQRESVEVMFVDPQRDAQDCLNDQSQQTPFLSGSLFILTSAVDDLWNSVRSRAIIKNALADREYLMRDFSILDNNGYELVFGEDISSGQHATKQV